MKPVGLSILRGLCFPLFMRDRQRESRTNLDGESSHAGKESLDSQWSCSGSDNHYRVPLPPKNGIIIGRAPPWLLLMRDATRTPPVALSWIRGLSGVTDMVPRAI